MTAELIVPDWSVRAGVHGLVTTRALGDMASADGRAKLRAFLPAEPAWLRQVHGATVVDAACAPGGTIADASFATRKNVVCAVRVADCMPVFLAAEEGGAVAIAHAGWRGLCAGVIEATVAALRVPPGSLQAWLGPAIGPGAYEVGEAVRAAFLQRDARTESAFTPARPGHWHLDLYAVARHRLANLGVTKVLGGGYCTASDSNLFYSYRKDKTTERMAAVIWLA